MVLDVRRFGYSERCKYRNNRIWYLLDVGMNLEVEVVNDKVKEFDNKE